MALVLAMVCVGNAAADVLYLNNGQVIHGKIVQQTDSVVKIKIGTLGEMTFGRNEIHAVESNSLDYKPIDTAGTATAAGSDAGLDEPAKIEKAPPLTEPEKVALDEALKKLDTDDPEQWQAAEDSLAAMGPKVFGRLEKELQTAKKPVVAAFMMSAMKRIDPKRAVAPIVARATNDATNDVTRQAAVVMLGELGDKRATDALVSRLKDKKYYIRRDAAAALARVKDQKALPALVRASTDNDPEVRKAAMNALSQMTKMDFKSGKEWQKWWDKKTAATVQ